MDTVLIDGDQAMFLPVFGAAVVVVQPGTLRASGEATVGGKKVCIEGDERSVSVPGCMYVTAQHPIPGTGTLEIASLADSHKARTMRSAGTPVLLLGGQFDARFKVQSPAQQPTAGPPVPDASTSYSGQGRFVSTNPRLSAS